MVSASRCGPLRCIATTDGEGAGQIPGARLPDGTIIRQPRRSTVTLRSDRFAADPCTEERCGSAFRPPREVIDVVLVDGLPGSGKTILVTGLVPVLGHCGVLPRADGYRRRDQGTVRR